MVHHHTPPPPLFPPRPPPPRWAFPGWAAPGPNKGGRRRGRRDGNAAAMAAGARISGSQSRPAALRARGLPWAAGGHPTGASGTPARPDRHSRGIHHHLLPTRCSARGHLPPRLRQAPSNLALNLPLDGAATGSLGSLCHGLDSQTGKNFIPRSNPNLLSLSV